MLLWVRLERWQNLLLLFTLSLVWLFAIPWTVACQAPLSSTITWSSLKFMSIELVMLSNHLSLCSPFLFLPSIFPRIKVFSRVSSEHQVAKVMGLQLHNSPFNEYSDFLQDWLVWSPCRPRDTPESSSAPQFESINSLPSDFFITQLGHPHVTIGKSIALAIWTFVSKVMSLFFFFKYAF